jgi:predicted RNA-binding Zn ribbon-like protein
MFFWYSPGAMAEVAPGRLRLVQDFVNTLDVEEQKDELSGPGALQRWLGQNGLLQPSTSHVPEADYQRVVDLRESLRKLLLANNGEALDPGALAQVEGQAGLARLRVRLPSPDRYTLEPETGGVEGALGRLVAIVLEAMAGGTWDRLKACSAHDCQWAFYDVSKNHSRHWCSMRVCGNRTKARQFRQRRRSGAPAGAGE